MVINVNGENVLLGCKWEAKIKVDFKKYDVKLYINSSDSG
jgi:hypothetical protein